jgi:hypothetical protein
LTDPFDASLSRPDRVSAPAARTENPLCKFLCRLAHHRQALPAPLHDALQRYWLRHTLRYGLKAQKTATWTNAPLVQVRCAEPREGRPPQEPAKKAEDARILPFSFAPLTLNVKDGREIVPDPTPAKRPRGLRSHGLRHEAKPLKGNRLCQQKIRAIVATSSACRPNSGSMRARFAP